MNQCYNILQYDRAPLAIKNPTNLARVFMDNEAVRFRRQKSY